MDATGLLLDWSFWIVVVAIGIAAREHRRRNAAEHALRQHEIQRKEHDRLGVDAQAAGEPPADPDARINHVVDLYVEIARRRADIHYNELLRAGVALLASHDEIAEACSRVVRRGMAHPVPLAQLYPSLDLKRFFDIAAARGYDFDARGDPDELADELIRPALRAAIESAASREEIRTRTVPDDADRRLNSAVEGMRPLIALLAKLREEIGTQEGVEIQLAPHGHMATVATRTSTRRLSLTFTVADDGQYRVEGSGSCFFGGGGHEQKVAYVGTPEAALDLATQVVGAHIGAERAHASHRASQRS